MARGALCAAWPVAYDGGFEHSWPGPSGRSVRDLGDSVAWYRDVLGLPLLYCFEGMTFFDCGGVRLMLQQQQEGAPAAESILYI